MSPNFREPGRPISISLKALAVLAGLSILASLAALPTTAAGQVACERSGEFFGCPATVTNVQITATCPGTTRSVTGSVQSVTATEFGLTPAESQTKSGATARREAERIARERALARCGTTTTTTPTRGGVSHTVSVGTVENGTCRPEGQFTACSATARNVLVRARCLNRNRSATGKLASMTATEFGVNTAQAQEKARATASREGERVALERALARLRC